MSTETKTTQHQPADPVKKINRRWTRSGGRPRPSSNFELFSWYFFRISGVLLLFFALLHLLIMHLINNVDVITYQFIAERWASPLWRTYDLLLLVLALTHGLNGVRVLIYDYIHARGWRTFAISVLYTVGILFLLLGAQVILTFQPQLQNVAPK
ncbi:MAG: Succinate dehydrogenase hydrophobic anchor subunit-like protein [Chloroflexi bacterium]|jgi:succinate dehydrogenase / fumarate reductase membrane anchor subunit|nr:Succinate dehydrogenase hydrophobic anchor subunit-like protein [Chloroflexota bacterium]